ncbi:MAG: cyclic peptide export ABC transporter [Gammaproteobacteria bacterium]
MELIWFLLRSSRSMVVAIILASVVSGGLGGALVGVVNYALAKNGVQRWTVVLAFVAVVLARVVTQLISSILLVHFAQDTVLKLCRSLCEQVLRAPFEKVEAMGTPRVLATLTEDVSVLSGAVLALPTLATNLAVLAGCAVYLGFLSWQVLLTCAVIAVIGVIGHRLLMRRAHYAMVAARDGRDKLFGAFRTLTEGLKELKLHRARREDFIRREIDATTEDLRKNNVTATLRYMVADTWSQLLFYVLVGLLLFIAPAAAKLSTVALTGYVFAALYMMTPTWAVLGTVPTFLRGRVSLEKIRELGASLNLAPEPGTAANEVPVGKSVRIEFQDVTFAYPAPGGDEKPFSVGPIDLTLKSGEVIFVTGGNGSGKSTLVKLLTGLYSPQSGQVLLDGVPVDDSNRERYREHFTTVFADYHLFERLFGIDTASREPEIREYLALLRLDRKVRVEEGRFSSTALSSGQRKRLALLTAFLEDRPVYVFDEWAADQDPSYKEVFYLRLLPQLKARGKCVIVVTHDDRYFHLGDRSIKLEAAKPITDVAEPDGVVHALGSEAVRL